jgi:hypothetical protein
MQQRTCFRSSVASGSTSAVVVTSMSGCWSMASSCGGRRNRSMIHGLRRGAEMVADSQAWSRDGCHVLVRSRAGSGAGVCDRDMMLRGVANLWATIPPVNIPTGLLHRHGRGEAGASSETRKKRPWRKKSAAN